MAFEAYGARVTAATNDPNFISVAVIGGGEGTSFNLIVAFGAEAMKAHNWKIGETVTLYFGTGEDKGKMLIKKTEKGIKLTRYGSKKAAEDGTSSAKILKAIKPVKPIEDFCNKKIEATRVQFSWDEGQEGYLIDLPDGFFGA